VRIWYGRARAKAITACKEAFRNLIPQNLVVLALLAATALVAGFFAYIYTIKRQSYLLIWTIGWACYSLHYLAPFLSRWIPEGPLETSLTRWIYALVSIWFFLGAQLYAQRKPWILAASICAAVLGLWTVGNALHFFSISVVIPSACLFLAVAFIFWQETRRHETLADHLLAISFVCWAVLRLSLFLFFSHAGQSQQTALMSIAAVPSAFVAMLMVMALYEEEKRRIERNMLALSNLNLATSSFVGGEIQRIDDRMGGDVGSGAPCRRGRGRRPGRAGPATLVRRRSVEGAAGLEAAVRRPGSHRPGQASARTRAADRARRSARGSWSSSRRGSGPYSDPGGFF